MNLMYRLPLFVVCLSEGIPHSLTPFIVSVRRGRGEREERESSTVIIFQKAPSHISMRLA